MEWLSRDARDIPPDYIKQICHTSRDIKTVTCLICDSGYCKSEFARKVQEKKGFFVSRHLIVCPEHTNITFRDIEACDRVNDGSDGESLILKRKMYILKKHLEDIAAGLDDARVESVDFEDRQADCDAASISSERSRKQKLSFIENECEECQEYIKELNCEKRINKELAKHNTELREHNNFLRNLSSAPAGHLSQANTSYANIVANIPKKQEFVQLIVKPGENYKGNVMDIVKKQVAEKTAAKVMKINRVENGTVYVKCNSIQDSEAILQTLKNENSDILTAAAYKKENPKVRITDILESVDEEELANDIIKRNQLPTESIVIQHRYTQRNNKYGVLAEVTMDAYDKIMRSATVYVGYQCCRVFDEFNINRCKKCCGYNHSLNKCKKNQNRKQKCLKCAGDHEVSECSSEIKRCINCMSANNYLTKKRSIDHTADDISHCESYKVRWEQHVTNTNYPWKPCPAFLKAGSR